jgi:hypothetical protein
MISPRKNLTRQALEVVHDRGPHPDFYEPVWCSAAIELLGIPAS